MEESRWKKVDGRRRMEEGGWKRVNGRGRMGRMEQNSAARWSQRWGIHVGEHSIGLDIGGTWVLPLLSRKLARPLFPLQNALYQALCAQVLRMRSW